MASSTANPIAGKPAAATPAARRKAPTRRTVLGALLAAPTLVHCTRKSATVAQAVRVVSLSPSTTEAMFALGAGTLQVGRSRYCDYPESALSLPVVGGFTDANLEAVLSLHPTLVVGARGPSGDGLTRKLEALGIPTYFPETETVKDVELMLRGLAQRIGLPAAAAGPCNAMHTEIARVVVRVKTQPRPRVVLAFGLTPLVVAGPTGFAAELLALAGGQNVMTEGPSYPTLPIERLLTLDPDVVLDAAFGEARGIAALAARPGWNALRALKAGRVVTLLDEAVLRPGPRLGHATETLAKALFPSLSF